MDKKTIARALGMLADVRLTMVFIGPNEWADHKPWINTLDQALGLIKNELTVEEAHTYARRNA